MKVFWMQCGSCSGDTWSMANAEAPDLLEALHLLGAEVLWHPSLTHESYGDWRRLVDDLRAEKLPLDMLVVEGAAIRGPGGTGFFDIVDGQPKKQIVVDLALRARFVVAAGTCASFGGIPAEGEIEATGLQFLKSERGGLLGPDFVSGEGLPVINVAGCPAHPEALLGTVAALARGSRLELDQFQRPLQWYGMVVHQGCTRNEYHEYRVEETDFGEKGCLFFHLGCQGPLTYGPCNRVLWSRRSSKTRAGVPCSGCTRPDFPRPYPFFRTRNIEGIPMDLPDGVKRAHYMVYKGMAAVAAPQRLLDRKTEI